MTLALLSLLACTDKGGDDTAAPLADVYTLSSQDQFPEGVAFHPGQRAFFMGSLTHGAITRLEADGTESVVLTPEAGWWTLGLKVAGDTLWACAVFRYGEEDTTSALWGLDVASGARVVDVDLGAALAGANCNDVAIHDGFVYLTDREHAALYRVPEGGGEPTLWRQDAALEPGLIGSNGVVVTPGGDALLVGKYAPPELLRVPLDTAAPVIPVALSGADVGSLPDGFDGITWFGDDLAIAGNRNALRLTSDDDWASATVATMDAGAAIAAVTEAEGRLYGLKGEVVPFVLGTEVDLPFELRVVTP